LIIIINNPLIPDFSPIAKDDWESSPYTRDAYYAVRANEVIFPAGVLQPPLYSHNSPSAVNFGAVGSLLAHEIFHAFDSYGTGFDADGNSKNLWTDNTTKNFQTDYNCVKASYQDYLLDTEQVSQKRNPSQTR
jgi:predicted metalloendopeptidase